MHHGFCLFTQQQLVIRLIGAVLAEQTDEWAEGRRYLGLEILTRCRLTTITNTEQETTNPLALTA